MRAELLIRSCFADDPQGVLAAICHLALVGIKRRLNLVLCSAKLRVAAFADAEQRRGALYYSEFPLFHDCSLAHLAGVMPVNIKWHHYRKLGSGSI